MARNKIGFHFGSQPNATGYGDYIRALDAAGIPAVCMSVGGEGIGDIVGCWDNGSTVPHVVVVRYMPPPGHPDGWQDVPRYDMTPEAAFVRFWAWVKPLIGPDVKRYSQRIVIKIGNELDKGQSEWLADFYLVGHDIMQSDPDGPFRMGAFGFASGEPEPEHWRGPRMLDYLRLCADDPIGASIVLHEYSYADTLQSGYPFLIGRFQDLFSACDENGIKRPYVYIHEWGWRQDTIPPKDEAISQLPWAAELYAKFPEIKGAGLWTLQGSGSYGNPHISKLAQPMIEPIKNYSLTAEFPDPVDPPAPPPDGGEEPPMIKINSNKGKATTEKRAGANYARVSFYDVVTIEPGRQERRLISTAEFAAIPAGTKEIALVQFDAEEVEDDPDPNPPPVALTLPRGSKGVDVSYWQGSFNWADSGAEFGIIRCSDGMTANTSTHDGNGIDRQFFANAAKLTALGIPWAIYHFLRPGSIQAQADKVKAVLNVLAADGTPPMTAVFDNGVKLPAVFIDVEDGALTNAHVQDFHDELATAYHTGIYTGKSIWELVTSGAAVWWANVPLWIAAYGVNDGNVPPWPDGPFLPRGWQTAVLWQYSSNPIDKNIVGPYPPTGVQPPPPPPPTGKTVDVLPWIRGPHRRQFDKEYKLANGTTGTQTTQVFWLNESGTDWLYIKGENGEYEHLGIRQWNGQPWIFRFEDTSEGPDRWYAHFMSSSLESIGAPWFPQLCEVGKWYETAKFVQHYSKDSTGKPICTKLNSDNVVDKLRIVSEPYGRAYESGQVLQVITAEWSAGEQYDFAGGNIAFRNSAGDNYWFMAWLEGRADKTYKKVDCLPVGW